MAIFFNFSPTSNHLHSLQVENSDSNSRLVVDEDDYGKFRIERVKGLTQKCCLLYYTRADNLVWEQTLGISWSLVSFHETLEISSSDQRRCFWVGSHLVTWPSRPSQLGRIVLRPPRKSFSNVQWANLYTHLKENEWHLRVNACTTR